MDPTQLKAFKFPEFAFSINICFAIRGKDDKKQRLQAVNQILRCHVKAVASGRIHFILKLAFRSLQYFKTRSFLNPTRTWHRLLSASLRLVRVVEITEFMMFN